MDDGRLARMLDDSEIRHLLATYADVVNRRAWPELDELFVPDCRVEIDARRGPPTVAVGGAGLAAFVGPAIERFDFFEFVILSARLTVGADANPDVATGRLYMCEIRHDPASGRSDAFGVYHDRYRRVDGRWQFAHRRYHSLARTASPPNAGSPNARMDTFAFPHEAGAAPDQLGG